jgi:OmpA-OmpF porin, OOP family
MKRTLTLLLIIAPVFCCQAQLRLAVLGGVHAASVNETNDIAGWSQSVKPYYSSRTGVNIGFLGEIPLGPSSRVYFHPGFFYQSKGRKFQQLVDTAATQSDTLYHSNNFFTNYIDIPLNLTLKLPLGKKSNFWISAGPYLSFFYNGKQTFESRIVDNGTIKFQKEENNLEVGKATNKVKTFDYGINARAGFELGSVLINGFFAQGLSNFYTSPYEGTFKHQVIGASIGFWLNKGAERKPRDKDKDGVPDKTDGCPDIAGTPATNGCPDKDSDGVPDPSDKCPDVAGLAKYKGCPIPDKDKDGVNDESDACPDVAGVVKYAGCPVPDKDKDGINDEADACPDKAGIPEFNGCPVPDSDGDGLNDREDKCPTESGTRENNGCPAIKKEIVEKVNFAARNIFFGLGSDKLTTSSFSALDEVVTILQNNPGLQLNINGYSDNTGQAAANKTLSQKRADAVKQYLVKKGIAQARLKATGYGPENPVAGNDTEEGRAKNRRVELKLSQQ